MSVTHHSVEQLSPGRSLIWGSMASAVGTLLASFTEWRRVRRAERELQSLDDRMLRDIGIGRSQIPGVARYGRGHSDAHP